MSPERQKPHLHELLAVEQDRKGNAERARTQTTEAFRKNQAHFTGLRRTFKPFSVDETKGETPGEKLEAETKLVTTVPETLDEMLKSVSDALDLAFQIDEANTQARADLVVDGQILAENVPATFLLQLEKRLRELRAVFKEIPTFDPVRLWAVDGGADKRNVLRAEAVVTLRKQRTRKYKVMYEATKEHPAQIDIVEVDEPIGEIRSYDWTGMLSPGRKNALLEQVDQLIEAVKSARSRANAALIDPDHKISKRLFDYLLKPIRD